MNASRKNYVAGHRGMVGSAIVRQLKAAGCENIVIRIFAMSQLSTAMLRPMAAETVTTSEGLTGCSKTLPA